jgi:hypothetical protein
MLSIHKIRAALPSTGAVLFCIACTGDSVASPPRILQVSASPSQSAVTPIREPIAAPETTTAEPPARMSRRSSFIPIAVPEPTAAPQTAPAPELSQLPSFPGETPTAPAWNISPSTVAEIGPQLNPPTAAALPPQTATPIAASKPELPAVT